MSLSLPLYLSIPSYAPCYPSIKVSICVHTRLELVEDLAPPRLSRRELLALAHQLLFQRRTPRLAARACQGYVCVYLSVYLSIYLHMCV